MVLGVLFGVGGAAGGAAARLLLARMRRGARVRAPVCELAVALPWALTGLGFGAGVVPPGWVPALLGLAWLGAAAGVVDVRHRRLPDALTLPALPGALVLLAPLGGQAVLRGLAGAAVAVAAHAAVHLVAPRAMGAGDVKLAGPLGAVLAAASWSTLLLGAVGAALLSAFLALAGLLVGWASRGSGLPHGPSMLLACWLVAGVAAIGPAAGVGP